MAVIRNITPAYVEQSLAASHTNAISNSPNYCNTSFTPFLDWNLWVLSLQLNLLILSFHLLNIQFRIYQLQLRVTDRLSFLAIQFLKQFITNRIQEINTTFPSIPWCYCPTHDNPADLLTKSLTTVQLTLSQLWQHGPQWLTDTTQRPIWNHSEILHLQVVDEEVITDT